MKKIILIAVFCAAVLSPAKGLATFDWSYAYWYCPVSWSEARVYFQMGLLQFTGDYSIMHVAGEGPLPDSNEDNTMVLPFQYRYGYLPSSRLPWRKGGKMNDLVCYDLTVSFGGNYQRLVTVDEGITHIGNWWFEGLSKVEQVGLPLTLQSIGEGAFKGCRSLLDMYCFDNVKTIGIRAFEGCTALSEFIRYENASDDGHYYNISEAPLSIGDRAFADCKDLKYFYIPANSTLGNEVFSGSGLESVDFKPGISFGKSVFQNCSNLKSVTIPANYTFGDQVFSNSSLETVTVNDNVSFGNCAFQNCINLKSVIFSGRINAITEGMFYGCGSLLSVNIPNGVTSIGDNAFAYCYGLRTVNIPSSVTSIGNCAFLRTYGLTSVTVPNSVTKIEESAFQESGLTLITVPGSVKAIEGGTFAYCQALTSVKLCEGVKTIDKCAFQSCRKLETVNLPASLEYIDYYVFGWCDSLKVIECNGTTPPAMNFYAFANSDITETSLCVPYGSVEAYKNAPVWKEFKNIGTYPAGIHIINGKNFTVNSGSKIKLTAKLLPHDAVPAITWTSSNSSVASVVDGTVTAYYSGEAVITATTGNGIFKDSCRITVKFGKAGLVLGKDYFQNSQNAKHITIPANCTLEDGIFANNSIIETVTVGNNVFFGKNSFQGCTNLKSVTFQGKMNEVTDGMFRGCSSLSSVNIPNGVTSIGNNAFDHCYGLRIVNIPNGVTSIGDYAFAHCYGLQTVNIPNSVTSIGYEAFMLSGLTSVTIPNSVTQIATSAFQESGLTSITVPGSVKAIEGGTFAYCQALTSVKLCEGVKTIDRCAFQTCQNLETVNLPASLEYIDYYVFGWCNSLKVIECNGTTPPAMNFYAFANSDITETSLCVPSGSVDAYRNADVWKEFKNIGLIRQESTSLTVKTSP